jgi:cytochrome oxidase assembly protein ShyY1
MSTEEALESVQATPVEEKKEKHTLRVITWFSVGMAVAAVGIFVGREIRNRYRFKRRTPYDFYSSAGERQAGEFGVGI